MGGRNKIIVCVFLGIFTLSLVVPMSCAKQPEIEILYTPQVPIEIDLDDFPDDTASYNEEDSI